MITSNDKNNLTNYQIRSEKISFGVISVYSLNYLHSQKEVEEEINL